MSYERFIEFLQELITMAEPNNEEHLLNAKNILKNLIELGKSSNKADARVLRSAMVAYYHFDQLLQYKNEFAGIRGDYEGNAAKRHRLAMAVRPGC